MTLVRSRPLDRKLNYVYGDISAVAFYRTYFELNSVLSENLMEGKERGIKLEEFRRGLCPNTGASLYSPL